MMDLTFSPRSFSHPLKILQIPLIFLLTLTSLPAFTETTIQLSGEIDGEVTFPCLDTNQRGIVFLYLQKGDIFVNGYHVSRLIEIPKWNNTILDQEKNVHMNQLNASHAGKYTCHIQYDDMSWEEKDIHLSVTAKYTKPNVTVSCSDIEQKCKVTCTSHGGYPKSKISWDVGAFGNASGQMWTAVKIPPECDTKTELCSISSTASFNCSLGLHRNLRCYVDDTEIFSGFSICDIPPPHPTATPVTPDTPAVPFALGAIAILGVLGPLMVWMLWKIRKGQRGHRNQTTRWESNVEEGHSLKD